MGSSASATALPETGAALPLLWGKVVPVSAKHPICSTSFSPTLGWRVLTHTDSTRNLEQHAHIHQPAALVFLTRTLRCNSPSLALPYTEQRLQAVPAPNPEQHRLSCTSTTGFCQTSPAARNWAISFGKQMVQHSPARILPASPTHSRPTEPPPKPVPALGLLPRPDTCSAPAALWN